PSRSSTRADSHPRGSRSNSTTPAGVPRRSWLQRTSADLLAVSRQPIPTGPCSRARSRGSVPSPQGVVTVEASRAHLAIDSPVPIVLDLPDQPERRLAAGHHELTSEMLTNVDARLSVAPAR